jgi:hypothetical protein
MTEVENYELNNNDEDDDVRYHDWNDYQQIKLITKRVKTRNIQK